MRTPCTSSTGSTVAAAQQGAHPGQQLGEPERLGDVVVGARVEPHDRVDLVGAGRQHEHRHPAALVAQAPAHLQPVHAGQAEVEHHQVAGRPGGRLQRSRAVFADLDVVALATQRAGQRLGDRLVVLGKQNASHTGIVGACPATLRDPRAAGVTRRPRFARWSSRTSRTRRSYVAPSPSSSRPARSDPRPARHGVVQIGQVRRELHQRVDRQHGPADHQRSLQAARHADDQHRQRGEPEQQRTPQPWVVDGAQQARHQRPAPDRAHRRARTGTTGRAAAAAYPPRAARCPPGAVYGSGASTSESASRTQVLAASSPPDSQPSQRRSMPRTAATPAATPAASSASHRRSGSHDGDAERRAAVASAAHRCRHDLQPLVVRPDHEPV